MMSEGTLPSTSSSPELEVGEYFVEEKGEGMTDKPEFPHLDTKIKGFRFNHEAFETTPTPEQPKITEMEGLSDF